MSRYDVLFEPVQINGLTIPNRFVSTSHAPGYITGGRISSRYVSYSAEKARGGVGLIQFGGATSVSAENSSFYGTVDGTRDDVIPQYRQMAAAIHEHGAKCTVQLRHGGRRERWDIGNWLPVFSSTTEREIIHASFPVLMENHDIRRVTRDHASAAVRARDGDIDGIELSFQAGTLVEQFLSPRLNQRTDGYGGSLENRMRLGFEILESVRKAVGDEYPIGIRVTGDQMLEGGLTPEDCVEIARLYANSGLIDFMSVVGSTAVDHLTEAKIYPSMWLPSGLYLPLAKSIRSAVAGKVKILHTSRIADAATALHAVESGSVDMVGMTRAFIADPHHVNKLRNGHEEEIRPCVGAGYCVDRVLKGLDALCVHNVATGREETISHSVIASDMPGKRVVVVGGGPGGLEAARICARRGHKVVLFEAAPKLGGQTLLAASGWKRDMAGITAWQINQVEALNIDIRCNVLADAEAVFAESPDEVIIATGGLPNTGSFKGADLAVTGWDILSGQIPPGKDVLIAYESGTEAGIIAAEYIASLGSSVEIATPDKELGRELGGTNLGAHMSELYKRHVGIRVNVRVTRVVRDGEKLQVTLQNTFTGELNTISVDQVIGENGTLPNDDLYFELKPYSINLGEVDLRSLSEMRRQELNRNPSGLFRLYRAGDAWGARNMHAAILDATRIAHII